MFKSLFQTKLAYVPEPHSTNFVSSSSSKPPMSEVVKPFVSEAKSIEVTLPRKIRVDFHESKPKAPKIRRAHV